MINFSTNSFNPLANFKVSVKSGENKSTNSSVNLKTNSANATNSTQNINSNSNEVLGYKVDKDGYFTEEFNNAAGIPSDYKIHSSTMQNLVSMHANKNELEKIFHSIDIAKSVGNAYKILSQVVGGDILNSKDSFTRDEIANFPQGYEVDTRTFEISNIYDTDAEFMSVARGYNNHTNDSKMLLSLFRYSSKPNNDIFGSSVSSLRWANGDKYTNADGSISKGGLLIGIMNENYWSIEGDTTKFGKFAGYDKNLSEAQRRQLAPNGIFHSDVLAKMEVVEASFAPNFLGGADEISPYKDPMQLMFEEIMKIQKEQAQKALKKRLNNATKVDIKA